MTNALRSPKSFKLYDLASTAFRWKSMAGLPSASPTEPSVVEDDMIGLTMEGLRKLSRVPQNKGSVLGFVMVRTLYVGVSGFSYPGWKGNFYPKDLKSEDFFGYYSQKLNSVEINSSFYAPPSAMMV